MCIQVDYRQCMHKVTFRCLQHKCKPTILIEYGKCSKCYIPNCERVTPCPENIHGCDILDGPLSEAHHIIYFDYEEVRAVWSLLPNF